jgi:hypothetical protein
MLTNQRRLSYKAVAILMSLVMLSVYVLMGAPVSKASTNSSADLSSSKLLVGRLSMADQQVIFVNGNEARTGTTIFSGMRLQSPTGVSASVQLGALGQLNLDPGADVTLDFSDGRVSVKVAAGDVTLTTNDGVEATVTTSDGNVLKSENSKAAVLSTSAAAAPKMSSSRKALWWIIGIGATIAIIWIAVEVSDDDSPR